MAGNPQGGGAPKPMGQMGNQMQGMRQGMAGMPSQYPGANMAAPGGGMTASGGMPQQALPSGFGSPQQPQQPQGQVSNFGSPQQPPQPSTPMQPMQSPILQTPMQPMQQIDQTLQQMSPEQQQQMEALGAQIRAQQGMSGIPRPLTRPADPRFQQNPGMTPRVSNMLPQAPDRPQIKGNPNAMPIQRGMR